MITASIDILILGALEAAAVPTESFKVGHKVAARPNPHFHRNGPSALRKVYSKYKWPMPENIRTAGLLEKRQSKVPANDIDHDLEYVCPVSIGGKQLMLDFDTGSSDLWVITDYLSKSVQNGHNVYACSKNAGGGGGGGGDGGGGSDPCAGLSGWDKYCCQNPKSWICSDDSFKNKRSVNPAATGNPSGTWSIEYGDGSKAQGKVVGDKVAIGAATVTMQAVECATSVSSQFASGAEDGLLGLGFPVNNAATPKQLPWMDSYVAQQKAAGKPVPYVFTSELKHEATGEYTFGTRPNYGDNWATIDPSQGWYQFSCGDYQIGSSSKSSYSCKNGAIADTGTTLMLHDAVVVDAYWKANGGTNSKTYGGYTIPCSSASKLKDLTVFIGSKGHQAKIVIKGQYMNYGPVTDGSTTCFGGLQAAPSGYPGIWGDVMLKNGIAVYDADQNKFGWIQTAK